MRLRRASAIAVLLLLTSAATAYAECGWVLWVEKITPSGTPGVASREWTAVAARERRNECTSDLKRDIEAVAGKDVGGAYFKRLGALDVVEFRVRDEEKLDPVIHTTR
jgi:hypothetical protein